MSEALMGSGVFDITPEEWSGLSSERRIEAARIASKIVLELVDATFDDDAQVEEVVIGGMPPKVLRTVATDEILSDNMIDEIAQQEGAVPFVFARPGL